MLRQKLLDHIIEIKLIFLIALEALKAVMATGERDRAQKLHKPYTWLPPSFRPEK